MRSGLPLALVGFFAVLLIGQGTVLAQGEKYEWQDENTLLVSDGSFGGKQLAVGTDDSGAYTLPVKDKTGCEVTVTIELDDSDVGQGQVSTDYGSCNPGDLSAGNFDSSVTIANSDKGPEAQSVDEPCEKRNGPLSWFGCGILSVLDGIVDMLDGSISRLLFVDADQFDSPSIHSSHTVFMRFALVILLPMMFLMVIGTAIGFGPFDAYTVRKALPRMLFAAIFIVISLPLCQFGIRLSNVAGSGVANLLYSAQPADHKVEDLRDIFGGGDGAGFTTLAGTSAIIYGTIGAGITWGVSGSFALVTIAGLLIGFVVLIMREVLLISLMVVAPIAILAWIFPGNDKLWNIWKTTFIAMLMMYPLISLLIASGRLVAGVVVN